MKGKTDCRNQQHGYCSCGYKPESKFHNELSLTRASAKWSDNIYVSLGLKECGPITEAACLYHLGAASTCSPSFAPEVFNEQVTDLFRFVMLHPVSGVLECDQTAMLTEVHAEWGHSITEVWVLLPPYD